MLVNLIGVCYWGSPQGAEGVETISALFIHLLLFRVASILRTPGKNSKFPVKKQGVKYSSSSNVKCNIYFQTIQSNAIYVFECCLPEKNNKNRVKNDIFLDALLPTRQERHKYNVTI